MSANRGFQVSPEYSNIKSRKQVYQTIQESHLGRGHTDIIQHGVFEVEVIASTAIGDGIVTLPANNAVKGQVLQNKTTGSEFNIIKVDGDDIYLDIKSAATLGTVGHFFAVKQFVMSQLNSDGAMEVVSTSGPLQFTKDAASVEVTEDTATPANSIPLPIKALDDDGNNVDVSAIKAVLYNDCAANTVTAAGYTIGSIATKAKTIQVSNNANDIIIEINGVEICASLAGSPINLKVDMQIGDVVVKSQGGDITAGSIAINIMG